MHAADRDTHLLQALENIRTLAERADRNVIDRLLTQPAATRHLDYHTLDFLRRAQDLIFITTQTLTTVLASDGSSSRHPAHLDAAEAWRRAHLHMPCRDDALVLIHIQEFGEGYQAIPILVPVPEPPLVPTIETATTLVIDKTTGTVTRWPLLRLDTLARYYRHYMKQEPMIFDVHHL
ncbi:hypothetical protein ACFYYL_42725 [Actinomadura geliboluensis]|uniref:hypothetical protein n=1 Tax=Actinomadura geliboluensis TaxID=882440 RepID=UPI00369FDB83